MLSELRQNQTHAGRKYRVCHVEPMHGARTELVGEGRHIGARDGAEHDRRVLPRVHAVLRIQRVQHPLRTQHRAAQDTGLEP